MPLAPCQSLPDNLCKSTLPMPPTSVNWSTYFLFLMLIYSYFIFLMLKANFYLLLWFHYKVSFKSDLFKNIFYWLCYYSCPIFSPLYSAPPCTPLPQTSLPLSSHPWVIHICSLVSPFPILFLTSPCLFCTYHLCFLFSVPFPHSPPSPFPLITLSVISISVILFLF